MRQLDQLISREHEYIIQSGITWDKYAQRVFDLLREKCSPEEYIEHEITVADCFNKVEDFAFEQGFLRGMAAAKGGADGISETVAGGGQEIPLLGIPVMPDETWDRLSRENAVHNFTVQNGRAPAGVEEALQWQRALVAEVLGGLGAAGTERVV